MKTRPADSLPLPLAGAGRGGGEGATEEIGAPRPHESAHLHVSGTAAYIDDIPELAGTLHAALGLSPVAHGVLKSIDLAPLRALPGVVDVITAADIPGPNDCGPIVHDDPVLAAGAVHYVGQPVFAVIASTRIVPSSSGTAYDTCPSR